MKNTIKNLLEGFSGKRSIGEPGTNQEESILPKSILPIEESESGVNDYILSTLETPEEKERYLKALEVARETRNDAKRFWNMLVTTVARSGYKPPQGRQTIILNLGCGRCEEGIVLSAFFGGENFGSSSENVKLIGVDIKQKNIESAIRLYSLPDFSEKVTKHVLQPNYEFIVGDATNLNRYQQIPEEVDVVVIRHQQISDNEQTWVKIFQQAIQRVSKDGIIIITSFSDTEHEMLIEALRKLDCEIVIDESNPYAKPLGHPEISLDRRVAIIRKRVYL
jgi:SAM-dependent methyltransferase